MEEQNCKKDYDNAFHSECRAKIVWKSNVAIGLLCESEECHPRWGRLPRNYCNYQSNKYLFRHRLSEMMHDMLRERGVVPGKVAALRDII